MWRKTRRRTRCLRRRPASAPSTVVSRSNGVSVPPRTSGGPFPTPNMGPIVRSHWAVENNLHWVTRKPASQSNCSLHKSGTMLSKAAACPGRRHGLRNDIRTASVVRVAVEPTLKVGGGTIDALIDEDEWRARPQAAANPRKHRKLAAPSRWPGPRSVIAGLPRAGNASGSPRPSCRAGPGGRAASTPCCRRCTCARHLDGRFPGGALGAAGQRRPEPVSLGRL